MAYPLKAQESDGPALLKDSPARIDSSGRHQLDCLRSDLQLGF